MGRADVEHQAKRGAPLGAGGGDGTGPRNAGASRGGSYQLSATKGSARRGVAGEADVLPASAPMASTGGNQRSELTGFSRLVRVKTVVF